MTLSNSTPCRGQGMWKRVVSSCAVWAALHQQVLQVDLLWETLAAPVSGRTSCASWVEHAGIFENKILYVVFCCASKKYIMHQVLCACACATSRLECKEAYQGCAQLASRKQRSLWYMRPKVHMQSHIVRHGCKHGGISTHVHVAKS